MKKKNGAVGRRSFLKTAAVSMAAVSLPIELSRAASFQSTSLRVWSCGGLAESFNRANALYEKKRGIKIHYTGAAAGALGKSLIAGRPTDIFGARTMVLTNKLKSENLVRYFKPLCFSEYVLITPKGNSGNIRSVQDLARPGVRLALPQGASSPGKKGAEIALEKAGIKDAAMKNLVKEESCVIRMIPTIIHGDVDVTIVERRLTRMPEFADKVDVITFPEEQFATVMLPFTINLIKYAKDTDLADDYINFMCNPEGQACFEQGGFIPAISEKGQELIERLGVKDG
ncbi:MAG TPA: substrate-binding domain-containing protein [Syntrophales bacterium]|nr:substrate-binding domain-containing protein [Syntrophales bacterium]